MSKSGQQHPKADVGGQRTEPKHSDARMTDSVGSVRKTIDAGKKSVAKTDAKK